ncbi:MAG: hypothetical protein K2X48_15630 [Chitinophagaceae bacterium]|nr:hypothetical protein [Chitinophagaceae bacterium]
MERIASLIEQLQQAVNNNANPSQLQVLTNMLQAELQLLQQQQNSTIGTQKVAVVLPASRVMEPAVVAAPASIPVAESKKEEQVEKVLEVLQVNEDEVEAELEEIRLKAEFAQKIQAQQTVHKPALLFEDEPEVPTLIHQNNYKGAEQPLAKEVNEAVAAEAPSLNDLLKQETADVAHRLSEAGSIKDLKKAIGINDRFVFINELFRGDEVMYERSIKTINGFSIYQEAQYWMERELKIKLGWVDSRPAVKDFYALVKRRFS